MLRLMKARLLAAPAAGSGQASGVVTQPPPRVSSNHLACGPLVIAVSAVLAAHQFISLNAAGPRSATIFSCDEDKSLRRIFL